MTEGEIRTDIKRAEDRLRDDMSDSNLAVLQEVLMRVLRYFSSDEGLHWLYELELSVRTANVLLLMACDGTIKSVADIARTPNSVFMAEPNFGKKSLTELRALVPYEPEAVEVPLEHDAELRGLLQRAAHQASRTIAQEILVRLRRSFPPKGAPQ
jgi:DNA-directed RNA polymerase alpha subunit